MHYFFPTWYENATSWNVQRTPWYFTYHKIEFDETIHQVRILDEQNVGVMLVLLGYMPQMRYHLHRHDLYETARFSLFDDLQGIGEVVPRTLQIEDFEWNEWDEFVYGPFVLSVYRHGVHTCNIEFTQESLISQLNFYDNGALIRTQIYDDRGFLSSAEFFENGHKQYQEYYNEHGEWQFRHYVDDHVEINPFLEMKFMKPHYNTLTELIQERLRLWITLHVSPEDQLILPGHPHHNNHVLPYIPENVTVVSTTFIERQSKEDFLGLKALIERSQAILVDRRDSTQYLREQLPKIAHKIHYMPSFDTRLRLGISQQKKVEILYYHINPGDFSMDDLIPVLRFVKDHSNTKLKFGIINADIAPFKEQIEKWMEESDLDLNDGEAIITDRENLLPGEEEWQSRVEFAQFMSELDIIRALEPTRLVIDLSHTPDVYIQIASISAGIPQINRVQTEYVTHLENGYILTNPEQFEEPAHYYLDQLKYWNEALIHAINKIRENTGSRFLAKWKQATERR